MSNLSRLIFLLFFPLILCGQSFGQAAHIKQKIWESVGGQRIGSAVRYIAFSAKGNIENAQLLAGSRKFLIDRQVGNCRFDGVGPTGNTITLLFNFKNNTATKFFIDSEEVSVDKNLQKAVRNQLLTDLQLLFLPTLLDSKQVKIDEKEVKLIGDQKLAILTLQSTAPIFGSLLNGDLYIEVNTGEIKKYDKVDPSQQISYEVGNYKEIGEGFRLPTSFTAINDEKKSCYFSMVSSFIQVEQSKFNTL